MWNERNAHEELRADMAHAVLEANLKRVRLRSLYSTTSALVGSGTSTPQSTP